MFLVDEKKKRKPWNPRFYNFSWIIFRKFPSKMRPTCKFGDLPHQIFRILLRFSKKCIPPFESKISGANPFDWPHTHTSCDCVHALAHCTSCCARTCSRVWAKPKGWKLLIWQFLRKSSPKLSFGSEADPPKVVGAHRRCADMCTWCACAHHPKGGFTSRGAKRRVRFEKTRNDRSKARSRKT